MGEIPGAIGLDADQVRGLLRITALAPSLHNTQPWRFRLTPDLIELRADPSRRLAMADRSGRELRLACGAALFNLRLGLLGLGVRPLVTALPDRSDPELIAVIRNGGRRAATPEQRRLLAAVPKRRTNRRPFADVPVAPHLQRLLVRAAVDEGAWLHLVTDGRQRAELVALARRAHEQQIADTAFLEELAQWTGRAPGRPDGVPADSGGPLPRPNATWVMRDFTAGRGRLEGRDFEAEPLIGVLSAHGDGPYEDVRTGEAMERVLLTATSEGLAVSFLSQLVEVPDARERMRRLIGGSRPPQVVLRIGHGWPVAATPRRAVEDMVLGCVNGGRKNGGRGNGHPNGGTSPSDVQVAAARCK